LPKVEGKEGCRHNPRLQLLKRVAFSLRRSFVS
jgi:hypothetical protein